MYSATQLNHEHVNFFIYHLDLSYGHNKKNHPMVQFGVSLFISFGFSLLKSVHYPFQLIAGKAQPTPMSMLGLRRRRPPPRRRRGNHPLVRRPRIHMMRTMLGRKRMTVHQDSLLDSPSPVLGGRQCLKFMVLQYPLPMVVASPWSFLIAEVAPLTTSQLWGRGNIFSSVGCQSI